MARLTESTVEEATLAWLERIGWRVAYGPDIAPDMPAAERSDYGEVILAQRLRDALARLNPDLPAEALEDAFRKLTRPDLPAGRAGDRGADRPRQGHARGGPARRTALEQAEVLSAQWAAA
jgi:type I site-specific restriction-modification system R (restriction) subunit